MQRWKYSHGTFKQKEPWELWVQVNMQVHKGTGGVPIHSATFPFTAVIGRTDQGEQHWHTQAEALRENGSLYHTSEMPPPAPVTHLFPLYKQP